MGGLATLTIRGRSPARLVFLNGGLGLRTVPAVDLKCVEVCLSQGRLQTLIKRLLGNLNPAALLGNRIELGPDDSKDMVRASTAWSDTEA